LKVAKGEGGIGNRESGIGNGFARPSAGQQKFVTTSMGKMERWGDFYWSYQVAFKRITLSFSYLSALCAWSGSLNSTKSCNSVSIISAMLQLLVRLQSGFVVSS